MPPWVLLVGAFTAVLTAAGLIGSSWGRAANLRESLEEARARDTGHLADLAESRAETAVVLAREAELKAQVKALQASLTGKVEWTQVVAAIAAQNRVDKRERDKIMGLLREIKRLLDTGSGP